MFEVDSFLYILLRELSPHDWHFIRCFSCVNWDDFVVVNVVYHIDWYLYVELSCISGINPTWSRCTVLLMHRLISFVIISWGFHICVHQEYWPVVLFSCGVIIWFGYQVMLDLENEFGNVLVYLKNLRRIGFSSCYVFVRACEDIESWVIFLLGDFKLLVKSPYSLLAQSRFLFLLIEFCQVVHF